MKKIYLTIIPIIILGIFIGYNFGFSKAIKTNDKYKKEIGGETLKNNPAPKCETCDTGSSRYYQTFDADGDGSFDQEIIIIEEIGMSQMAGRVIIIKEGKIVFTSKGEMRISVSPMRSFDYNNGFIISYSTEANSNTAIVMDFYKFVNGKYVLVKTIDKDTPQITYFAKLKEKNTVTTSFYWFDTETNKIKNPNDKNSWFYVSPSPEFGSPGSEEWDKLIDNNKDSIFKITGVKLLDDCDYYNPKICQENIYLEDIEIVKK